MPPAPGLGRTEASKRGFGRESTNLAGQAMVFRLDGRRLRLGRLCGVCADLLAAAAGRYVRRIAAPAPARPVVLRVDALLSHADDLRRAWTARPPSCVGTARHLPGDGDGPGRLRNGGSGPEEPAGGRLWRSRACLPHRVDVDAYGLWGAGLRGNRYRETARSSQAADAPGNDCGAAASDRAAVPCRQRGDRPRFTSRPRPAAVRRIGPGSESH